MFLWLIKRTRFASIGQLVEFANQPWVRGSWREREISTKSKIDDMSTSTCHLLCSPRYAHPDPNTLSRCSGLMQMCARVAVDYINAKEEEEKKRKSIAFVHFMHMCLCTTCVFNCTFFILVRSRWHQCTGRTPVQWSIRTLFLSHSTEQLNQRIVSMKYEKTSDEKLH